MIIQIIILLKIGIIINITNIWIKNGKNNKQYSNRKINYVGNFNINGYYNANVGFHEIKSMFPENNEEIFKIILIMYLTIMKMNI